MKSFVARSCMVIGLIVMMALALAYRAGGAPMLGGQPIHVATVNLANVLEKLEQRADADVRLRAMRNDLAAEDDKRVAALKETSEKLKTMSESAEKAQLEEDYQYAAFKYKAWKSFSLDKIDIENALLLKDLYQSIKSEVNLMAQNNGYDLVLVDDAQGEIKFSGDQQMSRVQQVLSQISARRLLYAAKTIDITDALITRMNNAHHASAPAAAPGAAPGAVLAPAATNSKPAGASGNPKPPSNPNNSK